MMNATANKVTLGLESCIKRLDIGQCPYTCPYRKKSGFRNECLKKLLKNALEIAQEEQRRLIEGDGDA